jgi:hypothetical protein
MFNNVAPVAPEGALAALERVGGVSSAATATVLREHLPLMRSLAYDPALFERSIRLLVFAACQGTEGQVAEKASETMCSLFTLWLSGTHATIDQRLSVVDLLLQSGEQKQRSIGLSALDQILQATQFSSFHDFDFGARSRDHGYRPRDDKDVAEWYGAALALIERLTLLESPLTSDLSELLARKFRGLWSVLVVQDELDRLMRKLATDRFWREGWGACRETIYYDKTRLSPGSLLRLAALEIELRPSNLEDHVRAAILGDSGYEVGLGGDELEDDAVDEFERSGLIARQLGMAVVADDVVFTSVLPDLLSGGSGVWDFGRGLADGSEDRRATWQRLVAGLGHVVPEKRDVSVLRGFLAQLWEQDRGMAQEVLDAALDVPILATFVPVLHSAVQFDARGVERLKRALSSDQAPVWMYRNLAFGRATDGLAGADLRDLIVTIADKPNGLKVALEILHMRFHSDNAAGREHERELLEAGREFLLRVCFQRSDHRDDYQVAGIARVSFAALEAAPLAADVAVRLRQSVAAYQTSPFDHDHLLKALLTVQPISVLDALFAGDDSERQAGIRVFDHDNGRFNPADEISCETLVVLSDQDSSIRYPIAASIITFARHSGDGGPLAWSEQAKALLDCASDPCGVVAVFVERFRPMSWSGSRAALMEANARLLDSLEVGSRPDLAQFVSMAKNKIGQEIARERQRETAYDRARDERFE